MRALIERSEWLFAFAKFLTLFAGWIVLRWYANSNLQFVRKASLWGSSAYLIVWCLWFFGATIGHQPSVTTPLTPAEATQPEEKQDDDTNVMRFA